MLSLVKANGDTVRRTALEAAAWGLGEAVTPNALDVALHRLKRKWVATIEARGEDSISPTTTTTAAKVPAACTIDTPPVSPAPA